MIQANSKNLAYLTVALIATIMILTLFMLSSESVLTLAAIGLVALACLIAWRPAWGVYVLVFCLPLINLNFTLSWMIIPFVDALAIVCLIGFIFYLIIHPAEIKNLKFPFFIPFVVFCLATVISALLGPHINFSLWYVARWIIFFYLAYVWFPVNVIKDKLILKGVLLSFALSGLAMAIMGVISLKDQTILYDPFRFTVLTIGGDKIFGLDQNLLVETLLPAIFFLLAYRFLIKNQFDKKLVIIINLFLIFVLLGTFSRGGWISFLICLAIYIFYGKKASLKQIILVGAISLLLLSPLFIQMFRLQTAYEVGVGSNRTRWLSTQIAWSNFIDRPLFGQGTGEYVNLINKNIRYIAQHGQGTDSNGLVQKIMAENGLAGILSFFFLAFYIFYNFYFHLKKDKAQSVYTFPIYLGALSIFLFEFVNTSYYHGKMWLPIAIAWSAMQLNKK